MGVDDRHFLAFHLSVPPLLDRVRPGPFLSYGGPVSGKQADWLMLGDVLWQDLERTVDLVVSP